MQLPSFFSRQSFRPTLTLFQRTSAPYMLETLSPIALIVIDDISVIFNNWSETDVRAFHVRLRDFIDKSGLLVSEEKSLPPQKVEAELIPFYGYHMKS